MQPYFFPYIGYFQLIDYCDVFVVYDNIQFTKKGWIHRNRYLKNGDADYFSLPLKKDSDYLDIHERYLSESFDQESQKLLRRIEGAYRKAPYFDDTFQLLKDVFLFEDRNLFLFLFNSLKRINEYLDIDTKILRSSDVPHDSKLKSEKRVIDIVMSIGGNEYVNPIGGMEIYSQDNFRHNGISLKFLKSGLSPYTQNSKDFIPALSIIDILMFEGTDFAKSHIQGDFKIVEKE